MYINCCNLWQCIPRICVFTLSDCKVIHMKALCSAAVTLVKINLWIDVRMYRTYKKIAMVANVSMFGSLSPGVIGPEF